MTYDIEQPFIFRRGRCKYHDSKQIRRMRLARHDDTRTIQVSLSQEKSTYREEHVPSAEGQRT